MTEHKREVVFISHATPEDNTFTLWLSARLKVMGYQIWSDVTQLFGGEKWWNDIEEVVDQFTTKFILVITKTSLSKPGVRREVELALAAENKHQLKNFIIPIIIDDSAFGGQPYGMSDRNIIPFAGGWAPALGRLVERLDRDGVPKSEVPTNLGEKLTDLYSPKLVVRKKEDVLISNWLKMTETPTHLNFYRIPGDVKVWKSHFSSCIYPWFEWGGMLVCFATKEDLRPFLPRFVGITEAPRLSLKAVLENAKHNYPEFLRGEVIKKVNFLIVESWDIKMRSLGLCQYKLANEKTAWFFPDNESFTGRVSFPDAFGVQKKKQVLGFSPKNNIFWHYAIEIKAQYGANAKVCLIPHVVFTEDGTKPLDDKKKMHRLRRGFCKSWWNDRWRDLLLLYLHMIAQTSDSLSTPLGSAAFFQFKARPQLIDTEYTLLDSTSDSEAELIGDEEEFLDVEVEIDG